MTKEDGRLIEAGWQRIAERLMPLEELKDRFVASMKWSEGATAHEKSLVLGNLNGFVGFVKAAWSPEPEE